MIKIIVLETNSTEEELWFKLVGRGRWADIPFYMSVDTYNMDEGWITFVRLDCSPGEGFKVGISHNLILVSAKWVHEVRNWLNDWGISHRVKRRHEVATPDGARAFLAKIHEEMAPKNRAKMLLNAQKRIAEFGRREDEALLGRIDRMIAKAEK